MGHIRPAVAPFLARPSNLQSSYFLYYTGSFPFPLRITKQAFSGQMIRREEGLHLDDTNAPKFLNVKFTGGCESFSPLNHFA